MKKILRYLIPRAFIFFIKKLDQSFTDFLSKYGLLKLVNKNKINNLKILKKNYDECFIIGGGPSIKSQNLNLLKNKFTIVHNAFFFTYKYL